MNLQAHTHTYTYCVLCSLRETSLYTHYTHRSNLPTSSLPRLQPRALKPEALGIRHPQTSEHLNALQAIPMWCPSGNPPNYVEKRDQGKSEMWSMGQQHLHPLRAGRTCTASGPVKAAESAMLLCSLGSVCTFKLEELVSTPQNPKESLKAVALICEMTWQIKAFAREVWQPKLHHPEPVVEGENKLLRFPQTSSYVPWSVYTLSTVHIH